MSRKEEKKLLAPVRDKRGNEVDETWDTTLRQQVCDLPVHTEKILTFSQLLRQAGQSDEWPFKVLSQRVEEVPALKDSGDSESEDSEGEVQMDFKVCELLINSR